MRYGITREAVQRVIVVRELIICRKEPHMAVVASTNDMQVCIYRLNISVSQIGLCYAI